ncbi:MAG: transglycosylase domain-containing protein, partial [Clostridia bacterium]|nr:transglycosylase domain-containing protein [Clostridia bacterium]
SVKYSENYTLFDTDRLNQVYSNLTVLDSNGKPLNEAMYYKNIKQIPLSALHKYTYMAFVAVEDRRFFDHNGIDVKRVAGALVHNLQSKSFKEGASTISQQLITNTHLDNKKTLKRKVNEMLLSS